MVPWEEHMDEVKEGKGTSYQGLLDKSRRQGWKIHCEALKVGCRGFSVSLQSIDSAGSQWGGKEGHQAQILLGHRPDQPWTGSLGEGV